MTAIKKIKGFADSYDTDSEAMAFMERVARDTFSRYGYGELRTPILEKTELFARGIGEETDVVQKEMYTFPDRKGRSLTMRPEATAGVMRAYIENGFHSREQVSKFFTYGPMFRYERPQKGRMRQFHQLNCECIGPEEPQADAEVILMLWTFLKGLELPELSIEINSLGCKECRPLYNQALRDFLADIDPETLCEDCRRRMETNPLRVLDCKVPGCKEQTKDAPTILESNCESCRDHFGAVTGILDAVGVPYVINNRLVRGLDYYVRTTFEVVSGNIGSQSSVAGGGRYDGLVRDLGGPDVPGVGFACGMERLALLLPEREKAGPDFYLAVLDERALGPGIALAQRLRENGQRGQMSFAAKSMKAQMRQAGKSGARKTLILGGSELDAGTVVVKDMESGEQETVEMASLDRV